MQFRTDLAMESTFEDINQQDICTEEKKYGAIEQFKVYVKTQKGAEEIKKAKGTYVTLFHHDIMHLDAENEQMLIKKLTENIKNLLPQKGDVLVLGLGNRHMTADALGPYVLEKITVTRHLKEVLGTQKQMRGVSIFSPGVMGVTGLKTFEVVRGLVDQIKPQALLVIDALSARETRRICATIQITDTGIQPGSGVGNHQEGLSKDTLNVPVIALGVPMVVYAPVIAKDLLYDIMKQQNLPQTQMENQLQAVYQKMFDHPLGELVVTPRDVDEQVKKMADIIAKSIDLALNPCFV